MNARYASHIAGFLLTAITLTATAETTAFRNVQILTMTDRGALTDGTVIVDDDRIVAVVEGAADIPEDARIVDGQGKTLMPGLADMHVHTWSEKEGVLYLANSVTTVRNMWGSSQTLAIAEAARAGTFTGPNLYTPGPLMDGPEPIWGEGSISLTSPEQAVGAVESQRSTGYKAVKLYEGLTPDIYRAAVKAAKDRDLQIYTHVPGGMTVEEVIALGVDSIEHFEGVSSAAYAGSDEDGYMTRWANADHERLRAIAAASAEAGVWQSPTFAVITDRYRYGANPEAFFARPESAFVGDGLPQWWREAAGRMGDYDAEKQAAADNQRAFLRMLYEAGSPLLIGTDTPNPFVLPGFAIHDELAAFVAAGIPVDEVLRIATADAAKFLREEGQWGVVAPNARADLVLLDRDPREDLSVLREPAGVMRRGHWYTAGDLDEALAELRERLAAVAESGEDPQ